MIYTLRLSKQAQKDISKLTPRLRSKLKNVLRNRIACDPYSGKALVGEMKGYYSVRLSLQDRIVYSIEDNELIVYVIRARTHYGD